MAFVATNFVSSDGDGARHVQHRLLGGCGRDGGNQPDDIALLQTLFRLVHFQLGPGTRLPAPPGDSSIEVDGKLGPQTMRFLVNFQREAMGLNVPVRLDGMFDPFRGQGGLSTISRTRYTMEILNRECNNRCRVEGIDNFANLPRDPDLPPFLATSLLDRRDVRAQVPARRRSSERSDSTMPDRLPAPAAAAGTGSDIFLLVQTGAPARSRAKPAAPGHENEIVVTAWSWGLSAGSALGSGQATARRTYKHLTVFKAIDSASTSLMSALATNDEVKEAEAAPCAGPARSRSTTSPSRWAARAWPCWN